MQTNFWRSTALLLLGVASGLFLSDFRVEGDAGAQTIPGGAPGTALRGALEANAAPSVSFDGDGLAKFSRPLEVPPLYAFDSPLEGDGRQIVLVDSESKRICVYWIRPRGAYSAIELVAARSFEMDVKLDNFNGEGLTPAQIREQANAISP